MLSWPTAASVMDRHATSFRRLTPILGPKVGRDSHARLALQLLTLLAAAAAVVGAVEHDGPVLVAAFVIGAISIGLRASWRANLMAVPVILLFDALVRRYLVNDVGLSFVKDAVLAVAYVKFAAGRRSRGLRIIPKTPLNVAIGVLAVVVVVQAANPSLPSPIIGIFGIYAWLWYVPVMWLGLEVFPTPRAAVRAAGAYLVLSIPIAVLSLLQQHVPVLNRTYYTTEAGSTAYVYHGRIIEARSVGTFASTGAYGDYLVFIGAGAFALILVAVRRRADVLALLAVFVGLVLSLGSSANRDASGAMLISLVLLLALHHRADRSTALALVVAGGLLLSFIFLPPVLPGLDRAGITGLRPASVSQRFDAHLINPIAASGSAAGGGGSAAGGGGAANGGGTTAPSDHSAPSRLDTRRILGHGSGLGAGGLEHVVARLLTPSDAARARELAGPEGGWADVLWEFGVFGYVPFGLLFATALGASWRAWRSADDDYARVVIAYGIFLCVATVALMLVTSKLGHPDYSILFWLSMGVGAAAWRPRGAAPSGGEQAT